MDRRIYSGLAFFFIFFSFGGFSSSLSFFRDLLFRSGLSHFLLVSSNLHDLQQNNLHLSNTTFLIELQQTTTTTSRVAFNYDFTSFVSLSQSTKCRRLNVSIDEKRFLVGTNAA